MKNLTVKSDHQVQQVFNSYPTLARNKLLKLRNLILKIAETIEDLEHLEETLKWGEPSYLAKKGSTIRIDWKQKKPSQYAIYFKCTSKLVPTFKHVYKHLFRFEKDRAIIFQMNERIPETELKKCIKAALTYHQVKHLPNLGIS